MTQTAHDQPRAGSPAPRRLPPLVQAMRIPHWIKNAFVLAPLLFAGKLAEPAAWVQCLGALAAFCLLSSGVYVLNDIRDRDNDRLHPIKRNRPIASGALGVTAAAAWSAALLVGGLSIAAAVELVVYDPSRPLMGMGLIAWTSGYLAMNLLYSMWLKNHAVIDVILVAMGFVFRAMAGAAAIAVPISPWLVMCTFTLCLFIALTKRRGEVEELAEAAAASRPANRGYTIGDIQHMVAVSAGLAIVTYSIYCVAPRTVARVGSAHLIWTIPLVVYGVFRYNLIARRIHQGDPVSVLLRDKVMWLVLACYVILAALVLSFGASPAVRDILDV